MRSSWSKIFRMSNLIATFSALCRVVNDILLLATSYRFSNVIYALKVKK